MTPELPDDAYLRWLYSQISKGKFRSPARTYWSLITILYKTEFIWFVPNDDNRAEDGRELRYEFIEETKIENINEEWLDLGCSMLEMLIGLSRRLSFHAEGSDRAWFWHLLNNLKLDHLNDSIKPFPEEEVNDILDTVIWRRYRKDGVGGLFPLSHARRDQTNVEIWYQLAAYLQQ